MAGRFGLADGGGRNRLLRPCGCLSRAASGSRAVRGSQPRPSNHRRRAYPAWPRREGDNFVRGQQPLYSHRKDRTMSVTIVEPSFKTLSEALDFIAGLENVVGFQAYRGKD